MTLQYMHVEEVAFVRSESILCGYCNLVGTKPSHMSDGPADSSDELN